MTQTKVFNLENMGILSHKQESINGAVLIYRNWILTITMCGVVAPFRKHSRNQNRVGEDS